MKYLREANLNLLMGLKITLTPKRDRNLERKTREKTGMEIKLCSDLVYNRILVYYI